jgi:hypothetical protein
MENSGLGYIANIQKLIKKTKSRQLVGRLISLVMLRALPNLSSLPLG